MIYIENDRWMQGATAVFRFDSIDVDTRTPYDGDSCSFFVEDSNDVVIQESTAMINESTGLYRGYWTIPSDTPIGTYKVTMTFINLDGHVYKEERFFVIY